MTATRRSVLVLAAVALVVSMLVVAGYAAAQVEARQEEESSSGHDRRGDDHIIVETFTRTGNLISTEAFGRDGVPIPVPKDYESEGISIAGASADGALLPSDRWSGGSPLASGCTLVTVRNESETALGATAYWFNTWTSWCWDRGTWTISDVNTGFVLEDVDSLYSWQGVLTDDTSFDMWKSGYSTSGYWHEKQAHFENCPPFMGCAGSNYPRNVLRSHSDGTWAWQTFD